MMATTTRQTAEERREAVLRVAREEFARKGFYGASTDEIARAAGISQPYLFRLFGTKKDLYLATSREAMRRTYETMAAAARGKRGEEALQAIAAAYQEMLVEDRTQLLLQLQCQIHAAEDPAVREPMRELWRDLTALVEDLTGGDIETTSRFFASGMLLNTLMAMHVFEEPTPWSERLVQGCLTWLPQSE
jgi:AcrR family transcriptional regulator